MLSFEPEVIAARDAGAIDEPTAARLIAIERREIFSVHDELRVLAWIGAMAIITGVGIIIKKHVQDIGPLTLAIAIGAAAAACYGYTVWRRSLGARNLVDDSVLLLGALLVSADVGFIEHQWHVLGAEWQRHFLLLAIVHAVGAYVFGSGALLSLSIAALAAWMGIERRAEVLFNATTDLALRAFACAAILVAWREIDRRLRLARDFEPFFEHFATNLAFWGALIFTADRDTRWLGLVIALALATFSLIYGFRRRRELFVIYAYVYGLIAVDIVVSSFLHDQILSASYLLLSTVAAIVALFVTHMRFRRVQA
jgi:hypothetical protein